MNYIFSAETLELTNILQFRGPTRMCSKNSVLRRALLDTNSIKITSQMHLSSVVRIAFPLALTYES